MERRNYQKTSMKIRGTVQDPVWGMDEYDIVRRVNRTHSNEK